MIVSEDFALSRSSSSMMFCATKARAHLLDSFTSIAPWLDQKLRIVLARLDIGPSRCVLFSCSGIYEVCSLSVLSKIRHLRYPYLIVVR